VISTAANTVTATIPVGNGAIEIAITPSGATAYVTNQNDATVSVISTATNTVTATIPVGSHPTGAAITPSGATAYITNDNSNTVSVISTATNTVTATIAVGSQPAGSPCSPPVSGSHGDRHQPGQRPGSRRHHGDHHRLSSGAVQGAEYPVTPTRPGHIRGSGL
jgi:YVTN family beta-propeller protein